MLHLFPETLSRTKTVVHFGLLDLMEDMKGEDEPPVSAWQKMLNRRARRRDEVLPKNDDTYCNYSYILFLSTFYFVEWKCRPETIKQYVSGLL